MSNSVKNILSMTVVLAVFFGIFQSIPMVRELQWNVHGWQGWSLLFGFFVAYTVVSIYASNLVVGFVGADTMKHPVTNIAYRTFGGVVLGFALAYFSSFFPAYLVVSSASALAVLLGGISCAMALCDAVRQG